MLDCYLSKRSVKGTCPTQPFIHHYGQRVLLAGWNGLLLNLLRSDVSNWPCQVLHTLRAMIMRTLRHQGNAKVTQQHLVATAQQHIFRLHIPVNHLLLMSVLERGCYLVYIVDECSKWQLGDLGVVFASGAIRSI